jgi:GrpB-like predicted nucleotidyltransferase (UPF0157 family)
VNPVIVIDYDSDWPWAFERLRPPIWHAVEDVAVSIEHVGSTSVPGLSAKPVIDIDVVVAGPDVVRVTERLTALGYEHLGDLGVPGREAFRAPPESPPHHLYVCPTESPALANHLAIRDFLRSGPGAAQAYCDLKRKLARDHSEDVDEYGRGKTEFLVAILRDLGFAEDALADIERMNRKAESAP